MCDCENCSCNDDPTIVQVIGTPGVDGLNGWSPLLATVTDGARRVHQIIGWTGGTGSPPSSTNQFIGSSGIVSSAALAADIRGATGATGATGNAAWTAVLANVVDGSRVVQQIVDWTGGGGTKPSIVNQFIGPIGIVSSAAAATNIRGATGATGATGSDITNGRSKITSADTTLDFLNNKVVVDGRITKSVGSPGANETLNLSITPIYRDIFEPTAIPVPPIYEDLTSYITPNDGITRNYKITFDGLFYIVELDGSGRVAQYFIKLIIDGVDIKEVYNRGLNLSGYSLGDRFLAVGYVVQLAPNKVIKIQVKKVSASTVRIVNTTLSIFGV